MTHPLTAYLNTLRESLATRTATEHTHRPALVTLFESLADDVSAINEPVRAECGAPDLAILRGEFTIGHLEAKDVGVSLDAAERSDQLKRYRLALENLLLTDYLEFRWYVDGDLRRSARLARPDARGDLQPLTDGRDQVAQLLSDFLAREPQPISDPRTLAERMARLTHLIRDVIVTAFENGKASDTLTDWRRAFADVLIPDLDQPENLGQFADMFAQTLSYGLFSARIMHETGPFTRHTAQGLIPRTNPFLRDFFTYITGPQLADEPYAGLVEDLIQVLGLADMHAILSDFGRGARQDDPMMHFYETFLAAYDPKLREKRGVYYTPMPVVSFIVRSVDQILKTRFGLPRGLADTTRLSDGTHKVLVLDPAVGTATFLYAVIDLIREEFMARNDAGMWSAYVRDHLLDRIFGFELMMAPYAVAHFKLALQLAGHDLDLPEDQKARWAYDFQAEDRIRVYLTNTLEVLPDIREDLYGPIRFVAQEAREADAVKQDKPIMVVLGNPPYAVSSANKGEHIEALMNRYKEAVRDERNIQPLSDDYIKFIRFAHDRIERTGSGIVAMITNNSYLSGVIHRGMREEIIRTFNEIFVVNLHGNSLIGEVSPNGSIDENVFDIRQGVSIVLLIKFNDSTHKESFIKYIDIWGDRNTKYSLLNQQFLDDIHWQRINPISPHYFFIPKDFSLIDEINTQKNLQQIMPVNSSGMNTLHDAFVINFEKEFLAQIVTDACDSKISNKTLREKYKVKDSRDWSLVEFREKTLHTKSKIYLGSIKKCLYRPFDYRWIILNDDFIGYPRWETTFHFLKSDSIGLVTLKQTNETVSCLCSNTILGQHKIVDPYNRSYVFPLFLYPDQESETLFDSTATSPWPPDPAHGNRVPNLDPAFVAEMAEKIGLAFDPHLAGRAHEITTTFGPEDILAYIYAVFHCPAYRERYAEFLRIDFPRVPLTGDPDLFRRLAALGRALLALHLMEAPGLDAALTNFPAPRG